ncbi:MAG: O-methyltransferase [Methanococcaceae archaeon]
MLKKLPSEFERGNISVKDGRFIYDLIIQKSYTHGLEIGTSNGYSALWQGLAFKETRGKLLTVEIDSIAGREAQENFIKAGLGNIIDLKIDDAKNVLKKINEKFDFIFIDTGESGLDFFSLTYPFLCNGGTIVIHNVKKEDPDLIKILENRDFNAKIKSHIFYNILICTKK